MDFDEKFEEYSTKTTKDRNSDRDDDDDDDDGIFLKEIRSSTEPEETFWDIFDVEKNSFSLWRIDPLNQPFKRRQLSKKYPLVTLLPTLFEDRVTSFSENLAD